jgi:AraC-like DNA-binding protein
MRMIRLNVSIYHNAVVCGNWRINGKKPGITCFHMVTLGQCRLVIPNHADTLLNVGDLIIFPKEIDHIFKPVSQIIGEQEHLPYEQAFGREGTGMLCGEARFKHTASNQILTALPAVFIVPNDANCQWLRPIVDLMVKESISPEVASGVLIDGLSELLFVYALRYYIESNPAQVGVLALYAHPRLSAAIRAIHQAPEAKWTLDRLAKHAAQSRTQFAKTFREVSGITAIDYLTWWRMQLAWSLVNEGDSVARIAQQVGYKSESAFIRVFKKSFGMNVGQVRKSKLENG